VESVAGSAPERCQRVETLHGGPALGADKRHEANALQIP
jgi:hypothetical protein